MQYIDLSDIVPVLKAVTIVTSEHDFVVSHFSGSRVTPKWRLKLGFGPRKSVPFP